MSAIIENWFSLVVRNAGTTGHFGSMRIPAGESTVGGDRILISERMSVDPEDRIAIFEQSHRKLRFKEIGFLIVGEGTLQVAYRTDRATDLEDDDYTPLGTHQRWRHLIHPCKLGPFILNSQIVLGHATAASETADDAGQPALWTTNLATAESHIIDKILVRNPSEDDVVIIQRFLVQ